MAVKNSEGTTTTQLLRALGEILEQARKSRGETLDKAAEALKMRSDKNSKANVHNIEKGKVFLPWKRVVAFAEYTQRDPASILITLAAAKAFSDINDPKESNKLYAALKTILNLSPKDQLTDLPREADAFSVEHYREIIEPPPSLLFWLKFRDVFLSDLNLTHRIAPTSGVYREISLLDRPFSPVEAPKLLLQAAGSDGIELAVLEYLHEYRQLFPVYLDASALKGENLEEYIDRSLFKRTTGLKHLSLNAPELRDAFIFIIHNLPEDEKRLHQVGGLVEKFIAKRPNSRFFILGNRHASSASLIDSLFNNLGFSSFTPIPISERSALAILKVQIKAAGLKSLESLEDWTYLVLRHPLWLGIICRLVQERKRVPQRWEVVRTCAAVLTTGSYQVRSTREGLYPTLRAGESNALDLGLDPVFLLQLVAAAASSIEKAPPLNLLDLDIGIALPTRYRPAGPLLEMTSQGISFTSSWIRCHFAALHHLIRLVKAKDKRRASQSMIDEMKAIYDKGDSQRAPVVEICLALLDEAYTHERAVYEELHKVVRQAASEKQGLAHNVILALDSDDMLLADPLRTFIDERPSIDVIGASAMYLRVMIEDQAPGWILRSLANTDVLRSPSGVGKDDALIVRPMLQGYEIVREKIKQAIDYSNGSKGAPPPDADIIICPHFSLAWQMAANNCAIPLSTEQIPALANLGFLANHYCKYKGNWIGIPFQFPTKFFCYRNDVIQKAPASLTDIQNILSELQAQSGIEAAIGLQGQLNHPALYYEWLAFAVALGGGDVLWDYCLQIGEVILDSGKTIEATIEFLKLFEHAHDQSLSWNWDGIVNAMAQGKIAMCLPFSDTVHEMNRRRREVSDRDDLSYVPFRLTEAKSSPYVSQKLYGYAGMPLHIFTGHVMVALNRSPAMIPRETRFMQWFLSQEVQGTFSELTDQSALMNTQVPEQTEIRAELFSSTVAHEYAFLPVQSKFGDDPRIQLSNYQDIVLRTISALVKDEGRHPDAQVVRAQLEQTAQTLREQLRSERS
jgi:ABC-type glycerol-3-phosphate transport system substrate-binding protein/transcriptional regulator with XRE-family HTH domain